MNRELSDKVFVNVLNVGGATMTTGRAVAYQAVASNNGVNAVLSQAAGTLTGFIGVASRDIAPNAYGLVQVGGFVNSVLISNVGTSITINAGDPLVPGPAGFFSAAPTYANAGFRYLLASNVPPAVSAAAYASGLIPLI